MAAETTQLEFERTIDFSPAIIFDALIDPDLLAGWLADADVGPHVGGAFNLAWLTSSSFPSTQGTITILDEPRVLAVTTDNRGDVRFDLTAARTGSTGSSTILTTTIAVQVDAAFLPRVIADWQTSLDQLAAVLRGHPVDWARWDEDQGKSWRAYHSAAGGR